MNNLDNRRIVSYFPPAYYLAMAGIAFRDRVAAEIKERNISKAELSRRSGVPYHAIDKFLKRDNATTSAENAVAISKALGLKVDDEASYDKLRELFFRLDEEQRTFLLKSIQGLLG
jgi:transcriptional regulator with XRE-family HTH domain